MGQDINKDTETEDWLKMLMYELIKISGDISLTPTKIITGWGTERMRTYGLRLKNKFWKTIFTGIEKLEEGFYYTYPQYLGEMVIWNTQRVRTRGRQLQARGVNSIGYGESRDELGITTINQIIIPVPKPINEETKKSNIIKTKYNLETQTKKILDNQEYNDIIQSVQNMLETHGTSLKDITNPGIGPQLEGLTRMLGWEKKGSKHFYTWQRAKINVGNLTKDSEQHINTTLGRMQSLQFFRGIYNNSSKIKCNPPQKFQEQMITMHRQALNYIVSKDRKNDVLPGCTFCTMRQTNPIIDIETHRHFYSDCIHVERYWTEIRDWALPNHNANYSVRDRIYGKSDQEPYSIDNTLLREARSTLWKCRLSKTIPNLTDLKNRLKRQIPTLLLVHKNKEITLGLKKLNKMAEN